MTIYEMTDSELLDAYKKADTYELEMCAAQRNRMEE